MTKNKKESIIYTPPASPVARHPRGELKCHNKIWAVLFIVVLVVYFAIATWIILQVKANLETYLNIDKALLPTWLQGTQINIRRRASTSAGQSNPPAGGTLMEENPPPVDL